jgi:flagellum-specific ATP synthase
MIDAAMLSRAIDEAVVVRRTGEVVRVAGLLLEASGLDVSVGDICDIAQLNDSGKPGKAGPQTVSAEVVGFHQGRTLLMPYADCAGIAMGASVTPSSAATHVAVGQALLGRVIDAFGAPLDGGPPPRTSTRRPVKGVPLNPLDRPRIHEVLETTVRAVDTFLPLGKGQRIGIFAGSGVGKSTLLGMIARNMRADVNVIALIGERGREVREFVDKCLGREGLARSVVIVATSDQPAPVRVRAAMVATAIAEYFRDQRQDVMLTMDSVTRFAMARREIGLSVGEPPTSRGYTPSVFAELPRLMERCGTLAGGGSITALYTVLVEGDDFNDPISDAARSILDGHIALSRQLANHGHYPAIDLLASVSRLLPDLLGKAEQDVVRNAVAMLSTHDKSHQMIEIGAYRPGTNPGLDRAIKVMPALQAFLCQDVGTATPRAEALATLGRIMSEGARP